MNTEKQGPVVTAVTMISASVEDVWRVLVEFDQHVQWHPILSLDAKPEQAVAGAEIQGHVVGADGAEQEVTLRIVDVEASHRLVREGGSLDTILGRHSFALTSRPDGTTEFTASEEFCEVDPTPTVRGGSEPASGSADRPQWSPCRSG